MKLVWINIFASLVILLCAPHLGSCQCNETKIIVEMDDGTIQSPNSNKTEADEYGKTAHCNWEFNPTIKDDHMLVLTVTRMRLYFVKNKTTTYCPHAYNLTINGEQARCERLVSGKNLNKTFCKSYYQSAQCAIHRQRCETKNITNYPVSVRYVSNGLIAPDNIGPVFGFRMEHKYIKCIAETTTSPATSQHTTTSTRNTTQSGGSTMPTMFSNTHTVSSASTDATSIHVTSVENNSAIISIVIPIGVVLLIILLILLLVVYKRRQQQPGDRAVLNDQSGATMTNLHQSEIDVYSVAEDNNQSNPPTSSIDQSNVPVYSIVGEANSTNQSQPTQDDHVTIINQSDVVFSAIENQETQGKETVHYNKTMVDNILYGAVEEGGATEGTSAQGGESAEIVNNILYGEMGEGGQ